MKVNRHVLCQVDLLTMSLRVIKHRNMQVRNTFSCIQTSRKYAFNVGNLFGHFYRC